MSKVSFKCPQCGANLEADKDREFLFCQFCGHKIQMDQISKNELEIARMEHEEKMKVLEDRDSKRDHILMIAFILFGIFFIGGAFIIVILNRI